MGPSTIAKTLKIGRASVYRALAAGFELMAARRPGSILVQDALGEGKTADKSMLNRAWDGYRTSYFTTKRTTGATDGPKSLKGFSLAIALPYDAS